MLCYILVSTKAALSPCSWFRVIGVLLEGHPYSQGAANVKVLLSEIFHVCVWSCLGSGQNQCPQTQGMKRCSSTAACMPQPVYKDGLSSELDSMVLFYSHRTNRGPAQFFHPFILLVFLIGSPSSSLDCSTGVADSSVYFSVVRCVLHNNIRSFFSSGVNRPASALFLLQHQQQIWTRGRPVQHW